MAVVPSIEPAPLGAERVDPGALEAHDLYEQHAVRIFGYCMQRLGSREEAEDAVQTTFLNAFRALQRGVVPTSEIAWLSKIAENVCLSKRRSTWRRGRVESPVDLATLEDVLPAPSGRPREELIGLQDALEAMPEQQRRAILLREWQGLSYREIGEELELSQAAVETLIFRARRSLAGLLTAPAERARVVGRRILDLGGLAAALKGLFAGGAAQATATAAVVTATAGLAVGVPELAPRLLPDGSPALAAAESIANAPDASVAQAALLAWADAPEGGGVAALASVVRVAPTPAVRVRASAPTRPAGAAGERPRGSAPRAVPVESPRTIVPRGGSKRPAPVGARVSTPGPGNTAARPDASAPAAKAKAASPAGEPAARGAKPVSARPEPAPAAAPRGSDRSRELRTPATAATPRATPPGRAREREDTPARRSAQGASDRAQQPDGSDRGNAPAREERGNGNWGANGNPGANGNGNCPQPGGQGASGTARQEPKDNGPGGNCDPGGKPEKPEKPGKPAKEEQPARDEHGKPTDKPSDKPADGDA